MIGKARRRRLNQKAKRMNNMEQQDRTTILTKKQQATR